MGQASVGWGQLQLTSDMLVSLKMAEPIILGTDCYDLVRAMSLDSSMKSKYVNRRLGSKSKAG